MNSKEQQIVKFSDVEIGQICRVIIMSKQITVRKEKIFGRHGHMNYNARNVDGRKGRIYVYPHRDVELVC